MNHVMKRQPDESTEPNIPNKLIVYPQRQERNYSKNHKLLRHRQGETLVGSAVKKAVDFRETTLQHILVAVKENTHTDYLLQIVEDEQHRKCKGKYTHN